MHITGVGDFLTPEEKTIDILDDPLPLSTTKNQRRSLSARLKSVHAPMSEGGFAYTDPNTVAKKEPAKAAESEKEGSCFFISFSYFSIFS